MSVDRLELYKDRVRTFSELHGIPKLDTQRLFERETDLKAFVLSGCWGHLAHEIGRREP